MMQVKSQVSGVELEAHRFIAAFDAEQAAELCGLAMVESFADKEIIFEEGEIPDFLYLVLNGQVEFRKHADTERYQSVSLAGANDFFGEFGVLDGQPRSAQAIACGTTTLAKIHRHSLMEIIQRTNGGVVLKLFLYIIQRLRTTTDQYVQQTIHKERMGLVGEMVNTIIHDFKSPFTGIHLASGMLKEMHPDEDTQEWCSLIQAQIHRMLGMTDELLEFARGSYAVQKQPVNLAHLLQRFEKLNRIYFTHANVELIAKSADLLVNADENKLIRVLQNLASNAIEAFNGSGGKIEIAIAANGAWAEIQLTDNGPGIPEAIRTRLFEAFVTYGKQSGTGLGTAIAKSIIDAHGGTIDFQSQLGEGTKFYIRLPLLNFDC